jgi:hypothetical protein
MMYPLWKYYPSRSRPPAWTSGVLAAFAAAEAKIDSRLKLGMDSNRSLAELRPALVAMGFDVEAGKKSAEKIRRPVLFGEQGAEALAYEVDGFHSGEGIALEVEAGRGVLGNAVYRDLIQTSLLIDAQYLVVAVLLEYHYTSGGKPVVSPNYQIARSIVDAIYASNRLVLPFTCLLLIGY